MLLLISIGIITSFGENWILETAPASYSPISVRATSGWRIGYNHEWLLNSDIIKTQGIVVYIIKAENNCQAHVVSEAEERYGLAAEQSILWWFVESRFFRLRGVISISLRSFLFLLYIYIQLSYRIKLLTDFHCQHCSWIQIFPRVVSVLMWKAEDVCDKLPLLSLIYFTSDLVERLRGCGMSRGRFARQAIQNWCGDSLSDTGY